ncbi:hypothetical protein QJS10_CPB20g00712 [Acorus calamus]|uniref:Uncharacterized protein n=1 Tax=Acorus calamus TaxID=4465 RepID=A0AAV9C929_ACOCL|nr:hypothetical protein QJS10_CPB20g00712 [Acorus calamus]
MVEGSKGDREGSAEKKFKPSPWSVVRLPRHRLMLQASDRRPSAQVLDEV